MEKGWGREFIYFNSLANLGLTRIVWSLGPSSLEVMVGDLCFYLFRQQCQA